MTRLDVKQYGDCYYVRLNGLYLQITGASETYAGAQVKALEVQRDLKSLGVEARINND